MHSISMDINKTSEITIKYTYCVYMSIVLTNIIPMDEIKTSRAEKMVGRNLLILNLLNPWLNI